MKDKTFEPELLQVFRWLVSARLVLLLLSLAGKWLSARQVPLRYPMLGIAGSALLLGYLCWPWLRARLGRVYLPLALLMTTAGPILGQALTVALRLRAGAPPETAAQDFWQSYFVLFVPLILVSWQYNAVAVTAFCMSTTTLDLLLYLPLAAWGGIRYASVAGLTLVRSLLFALVGYIVVRLARAQRAQQEALARANARLAHYATTLEQLTVSRERNRLARELHDTLAHTLSGVAVQLEAARSLWDSDDAAAREMVTQSLAATRAGLSEARGAIHALRAAPVEDLGLALAVRSLARSAAERGDLALELQMPEDAGELAPAVEQAVYRIAAEALDNAARHAQASSVLVRLERDGARLALTVRDDGRGFDAAFPAPEGHYGLQGMRERAEMVGGELVIESQADKGTTVRLQVEAGT
jgi:signal transduction histidine kinase